MPILQYTLEEAYSGNTQINCYKDGKKINEHIVSNWALEGYLNCLDNEGYELAYDVDAYRKAWEEAKREEEIAHDAYTRALSKRLYKYF